jgi:hypothetical protein
VAEYQDEAPGWDAIDAAIAPYVRDISPNHWGTGTGVPNQGGLWGVSGYRMSNHWFLVTYGLSELFMKVTGDPNTSGWGEELTMRTTLNGDGPPQAAAGLLARLGEFVYERSTPFLRGDRFEVPDGGGDIPPALAWSEVPRLEPITTPFGALQFVATVGVSLTAVAAMQTSSTATVINDVKRSNPLLVIGGPGLTW